jgi:magnesium chelatase family protein
MAPRQVRKFCTLKPEAQSILKAPMEELGLSARAHDKVLRVARTIADLEHRRGGGIPVARSQCLDIDSR